MGLRRPYHRHVSTLIPAFSLPGRRGKTWLLILPGLAPSPSEGDEPGHETALRAVKCLASLSRMQAAKWTGWGRGAGLGLRRPYHRHVSTLIPAFSLPGRRSKTWLLILPGLAPFPLEGTGWGRGAGVGLRRPYHRHLSTLIPAFSLPGRRSKRLRRRRCAGLHPPTLMVHPQLERRHPRLPRPGPGQQPGQQDVGAGQDLGVAVGAGEQLDPAVKARG